MCADSEDHANASRVADTYACAVDRNRIPRAFRLILWFITVSKLIPRELVDRSLVRYAHHGQVAGFPSLALKTGDERIIRRDWPSSRA
jgi:hypothetical protein